MGVGAVTLAVFLALAVRTSDACMPRAWHPRQDALVLYHDGVEVIVWRTMIEQSPPRGTTNLISNPAAQPGTPLAWLLVVPSTPIGYEVVSVADFDATITWSATRELPPPLTRGGGGGPGGGGAALIVGATTQVGEYDVTPITGTGAGTAAALDAWLRAGRFPALQSPEAATAYATAGATFLAVRARWPRTGSRAALRPLAIAFRSPQITIPMRLSAGEAPFDLGVSIFSTRVPMLRPTYPQGLGPVSLVPTGGATVTPQVAQFVAAAEIPAGLRAIVARVVARVPAFARMQSGALAFARLVARPVRADAAMPDPTIDLGTEVPVGSPTRGIGMPGPRLP